MLYARSPHGHRPRLSIILYIRSVQASPLLHRSYRRLLIANRVMISMQEVGDLRRRYIDKVLLFIVIVGALRKDNVVLRLCESFIPSRYQLLTCT